MIVTLLILSKKVKPNEVITKNEDKTIKEGYIEVEKSVYDALIAKVEKLEKELEELKENSKEE